MVKSVGDWNRVRIVSQGGHVEYWLNDVKIVEFDRDSADWHEQYKSSKHVNFEHFATTRCGHIGLQDHGDEVFFRNIKIKRL